MALVTEHLFGAVRQTSVHFGIFGAPTGQFPRQFSSTGAPKIKKRTEDQDPPIGARRRGEPIARNRGVPSVRHRGGPRPRPFTRHTKKGRLRRDVPLMIQLPGSGECELLLDGLELIRANAAHGANIVLGQLGGVDLDLEAANNANELVSLVSHDGSFHRRMNVSRVYPSSKCHTQAE